MSDQGVPLTSLEERIIAHSLGISQVGREYRNHYCATPGHENFTLLKHMVERGLMAERKIHSGVFYVTEAGRSALHAAPNPTSALDAELAGGTGERGTG